MGHDFSAVRIHDDSTAQASAASLHAHAYAAGEHLVFGRNQYRPWTRNGRALLVHELTHSLQQGRWPGSPKDAAVAHESHPLEREAAVTAGRAIAGPTPRVAARGQGGPILLRVVQSGASPPADPGAGEGVDVTFILKAGPEDPPELKAYIGHLTVFVKTVLKGQQYFEVDDLTGIFHQLEAIAATGRRVRRIRIVGHGSHGRKGGRVLVHDVPEAPAIGHWLTPNQVLDFARDPKHEATIKKLMTPDAVVEFWGCSLGGYPQAGRAWATLFQARFIATPGKLVESDIVLPIPALPGKGEPARDLARRYGLRPDPPLTTPQGRWAQGRWSIARTSSEAEASVGVKPFASFLVGYYVNLAMSGNLPKITEDPEVAYLYMRQLFDQARGEIWKLTVHVKGQTLEPKGKVGWDQAWVTFDPLSFDELAKQKPQRPVKKEPAAPPAPSQRPAPPGAPMPTPGPPPVPIPAPAPAPSAPTPPSPPAPPAAQPRVPARPVVPSHVRADPAAWGAGHREGAVTHWDRWDWILYNFDVGHADLKPEHRRSLESIVAEWKKVAADPASFVQVDGHASRTGGAARNQDLSAQRAEGVRNFLTGQGVSRGRIEAYHHGFDQPWLPEDRPGEIAHNRRVEVRIMRKPTPEPRLPLEPPRVPAAADAPRPTHLTVADLVPGFSVEAKVPILPLPEVPSPWVILYPGVEAKAKAELLTAVPAAGVASWNDGAWSQAVRLKLGEKLKDELKIDPGGKVSAKLGSVPLEPEFELDIKKLLSEPTVLLHPVSVSFKLLTISLADLDLGHYVHALAGVRIKVSVDLKLKVAIGPSPALLARIGPAALAAVGEAGLIIGGALVLTAGGVYLTAVITEHARQRGVRWAITVNRRSGYAWRIAAEASDWRPAGGRSMRASSWNEARRHVERFRESGEDAYLQGYIGWSLAEQALALTAPAVREAALKALHDRHPTDIVGIQRDVLVAEGWIKDDDVPPPKDLTFLSH